jgi:L-ribulose-5-phosphate 4-epimerase
MITNLRKEVLHYAQKLYKDRLVSGTSGNISVYDPESNLVVITPGSEDYMEMTEDRIVVIDLDGNVVSGDAKPSSEWPMHAEIYKNRKDIKSVVHTHSPYATGFAVLNEPIPLILTEMIPWLKGQIEVTPLCIPGTAELGIAALSVLEDKNVCLLSNHGVLAVGDSLRIAYDRAVYVEDAARVYYIAKSIGEPCLIPEPVVMKMIEKYN